MESRKKRCRHCRCLFVAARNPQQKFCSRRLCQNVRKAIWRREKHEHDPDYCANRNQACKRWRRKNPDYWKPYREAHPGYTERNKSKQRQRKQALCRRSRTPDGGTAPQFANSDALKGVWHYFASGNSDEYRGRSSLTNSVEQAFREAGAVYGIVLYCTCIGRCDLKYRKSSGSFP